VVVSKLPKPVEKCAWPGCPNDALCQLGNYGNRLVCSLHFEIVSGRKESLLAQSNQQLRVLENRYVELRSMADGSLLRTATFNNVDHIVVPIVTAVGDNVWWPANAPTPEFVPASVLAAHAFSRNNRPIVMGHPKSGGDYVSANDPKIIEECGFGQMFASQFENGRIKVEAWLDPAKAEKVGSDAVAVCERLQSGEQVEVSEGDYVVTRIEKGEFGGKPYGAVWISAVSDHLAMLAEGDVGACSNEMGCGGPRVAVLRASDGKDDKWAFGVPTAGATISTSALHTAALSQARRPSFTGTESVRWSKPSFADYIKYLDSSSEPPKTVAQCSSELKEKIAVHTLLGDPSASSFADLSLFPVVNPANDKLNERALRAVLSGRGSASVSDVALASAQEIARRLLNSEFSASIVTSQEGRIVMGQRKDSLFKRMLASIRASMSNNDLRWQLYKAVSKLEPGVEYVEDEDVDTGIFRYVVIVRYGDYWMDDSVIEYHYFQRTFTIDGDNNVTVNDDRVEYVYDENSAWKPLNEVFADTPEMTANCECKHKGDDNMKPTVSQAQKDLVSRLITSSGSPFEESDRSTLESMSEDKLGALADAYKEAEKVAENPAAPIAEASTVTASAASPAAGQRVLTEAEYLSLKSAADAFQRQQERHRANLVTSLKAACGSAFTEADLNGLDTPVLEKLAASHHVDMPATVDFSVRGIPTSGLSLSEADKLKAHKPSDTWGLALAKRNKQPNNVAN